MKVTLLVLLFASIEAVESGGNHQAVSHRGASGTMQVMRPTWEDMTRLSYDTYRFNAAVNRGVGIRYLRWLDKRVPRSFPPETRLELIAAAYNGGLNRLKRHRWNVSRMPYETRAYVLKVKSILPEQDSEGATERFLDAVLALSEAEAAR